MVVCLALLTKAAPRRFATRSGPPVTSMADWVAEQVVAGVRAKAHKMPGGAPRVGVGAVRAVRQAATGLSTRRWRARPTRRGQEAPRRSGLSRPSRPLPRDGDLAGLRGAYEEGRGNAMTAVAPMRLGHASVRSRWIVGRRNRGPRHSHSPRPRRDIAPMGDRLDVVQEFHAAVRQARRVPRRTHSQSPGGCGGDRHRGRGRTRSLPRHTFLHGRSTRRRAVAAFHCRAIEDRADIEVTLRSSFLPGRDSDGLTGPD